MTMMKLKYTILALAVTSLAANAATVKIGFGTVTGARDAGQASPMWGQSATADYLSTPAGPHGTVYLNDFSYQAADDGTRTTGIVFLHAYKTFTTNGDGAIASIAGFAATSTSTIDLGAIGNDETMTWNFSGADAFVAETKYYFLMSTSDTEVTIDNTSSMKTAAFALDTTSTYDGGEAVRANAALGSNWDQHFEANFNTVSSVPEPSSTALLGLGGLALILRRRK
jgi:hypothetical protein